MFQFDTSCCDCLEYSTARAEDDSGGQEKDRTPLCEKGTQSIPMGKEHQAGFLTQAPCFRPFISGVPFSVAEGPRLEAFL